MNHIYFEDIKYQPTSSYFFRYFPLIHDYIKNGRKRLIIVVFTKYLFINISRIDDIQDNSVLRRGIPVAHNIYGVASTINASNYGLFIALEKVMALNHPEVNMLYKNSPIFIVDFNINTIILILN